MTRTLDGIERIMDRLVLDENGCWLWEGARQSGGYGHIMVGSRADNSRRMLRVHRVTYQRFRGVIPEGLTLDHLCRVRHCANPWHCEPVTHRENVLRGEHPNVVARRMGRCKRGHPAEDADRDAAGRVIRCRTCSNDARRERRRLAAK